LATAQVRLGLAGALGIHTPPLTGSSGGGDAIYATTSSTFWAVRTGLTAVFFRGAATRLFGDALCRFCCRASTRTRMASRGLMATQPAMHSYQCRSRTSLVLFGGAVKLVHPVALPSPRPSANAENPPRASKSRNSARQLRRRVLNHEWGYRYPASSRILMLKL
jgi:hypothetical protein